MALLDGRVDARILDNLDVAAKQVFAPYLNVSALKAPDVGLIGRATDEDDGTAPDEGAALAQMFSRLAAEPTRWVELPNNRFFKSLSNQNLGARSGQLIETHNSFIDIGGRAPAATISSDYGLGAVATYGPNVLVTGDLVAGTDFIPVANATGVIPGVSFVYLRSLTQRWEDNVVTTRPYNRGEIHPIEAVETVNGVLGIRIQDPLLFSYVGANARAQYYVPIDRLTINGLGVIGSGVGGQQNAFYFSGCKDLILDRIVGRDCEAKGVHQDNSWMTRAYTPVMEGITSPSNRPTNPGAEVGYGFSALDACRGSRMEGGSFKRCRHAVATSGNYPAVDTYWGGFDAVDCGINAGAIDTHESAVRTVFERFTVRGGTRGGVIRSSDAEVRHFLIEGVTDIGLQVHAFAVGNPAGLRNIRIHDGRIYDTGDDGLMVLGPVAGGPDQTRVVDFRAWELRIARSVGNNVFVRGADRFVLHHSRLENPAYLNPNGDGRNIRFVGTVEDGDQCTDAELEKVKLIGAPKSAIYAQRIDGLLLDRVTTQTPGTYSAEIENGSRLRVEGGTYAGGMSNAGHAFVLTNQAGAVFDNPTMAGDPTHTAADAVSIQSALKDVKQPDGTTVQQAGASTDFMFKGGLYSGFRSPARVATGSSADRLYFRNDPDVAGCTETFGFTTAGLATRTSTMRRGTRFWSGTTNKIFTAPEVAERLVLNGATATRSFSYGLTGHAEGDTSEVVNATAVAHNVCNQATANVIGSLPAGKRLLITLASGNWIAVGAAY